MRKDIEILKDFKENNPRTDQGLIVELLLDIRSLLLKEIKPKGKTRKEWEELLDS